MNAAEARLKLVASQPVGTFFIAYLTNPTTGCVYRKTAQNRWTLMEVGPSTPWTDVTMSDEIEPLMASESWSHVWSFS